MKKYKCNIAFRPEIRYDYIYDEARGEPERGIVAMTEWNDLPLDYVCPRCGLNKEAFALYEAQTTIK